MFIIQLIIIQIITFAALVFVLRKIMYSASFTETKRLQQLNRENAGRAQELAAKMDEAEKQYKDRLEAAEREANKLKAQAREESERLKREALSKARQEAERIVKQALNTKEKVKEELEAQIEQKCVVQSLVLIEKVLNSKSVLFLHSALVKDILEEIDKIDESKLAVNTDKGELILANEITKADKEALVMSISKKTGRNISLEELIDKSLIAGMTIKLGSLIIDGSLSGKLKEACEALK